jgi:phage shock protein C
LTRTATVWFPSELLRQPTDGTDDDGRRLEDGACRAARQAELDGDVDFLREGVRSANDSESEQDGIGPAWTRAMARWRGLHRSRRRRLIAGVAGGMAESLGLPTWLVRLVWVALLLPGGLPGLVPYVVLWIVLPSN